MQFLIEDDDLLEKYKVIQYKVRDDVKKRLNSEPACNKKSLKTKIKSHSDEVTDFDDREVLKVDPNHTCLAAISLDSALNKDGNYYLEVSLIRQIHCKKSVNTL